MRPRPATPADASGIARLHLRTALYAFRGIFPPDAPPPTVADLTVRWSGWLGADRPPGQEGWVVEDDRRLVGAVLAGPDPDDPAVGHLSRLSVDPDWWGLRIGRCLHDEAVAHLRRCHFDSATLWVLEANGRARGWCERLGWTLSGRRKAAYEPGRIDDVGYERPLRIPLGRT